MSRFTKDAMMEELRFILLCQADHILLTASYDVAANFIGFGVGLYPTYKYMFQEGVHTHDDEEIPEVDLSRFSITSLLKEAYDFAFTPSLFNDLNEGDVSKLVAFMNGVPRMGEYGGAYSFTSNDGLCQTIVDAAHARWKLEMERAGTFSARELALLANMSEGAVRNAMSDKSASGLRIIPGEKPAQVDQADAHSWLLARRGFIPTPTRPGQDSVLKERLAAVRTGKELGQLISLISGFFDEDGHNFEESEHTHNSYFEVDRSSGGLAALSWSRDEYTSWLNGTYSFDAGKAVALARALDLDGPTFAAKALEASLRRDAEPEGNER